jgi:hypothetical protein
MPLIQLPLQLPATVGVNPNIRYMVTTDPLATITASSYLNAGNLEGYTVSTNDILFVLYSYSTNTKTGSFGIFTVGITNGVITLSAWADTTNITLPTIANDLMVSTNTAGQLASLSGTATLPAGSNIVLPKVNATEAANAVTASGMSGVITTSSLTTAGAGSYAITWTNTKIATTSVIQLTLMGGTNTTQNITIAATAGAGTSTLTIYNNTAATALNGTILIGYTIF